MNLPRVEGGFTVIAADPPWSFKDKGSRIAPDQVMSTSDDVRHYQTMSTPAICALPVADIVAPDAVLLLWFPDTHLAEALVVQRAWGFEYKHLYPWVKGRVDVTHGGDIVYQIGMGHWFRKCHEVAMLCVRGKPVVLNHAQRSATVEPRGRHSAKPEQPQNSLDLMFKGPKLEMFARRPRPGWVVWGDEAPNG